ncbi:major facilitator superfamily domain-containing protein [Truncatella angustata]|uniref:Major facilitator superfamily domain-containing protein n=1 Tax=Truncatella angustata TaxID=152316 RepID=A0A9P8URD6_9PEZI|nr:major facilitator superfamily domain-containing protein [Truncatella angustata]KAH6657595.1 major facilitator superfamily domain-containing protein [Truncatella angustata]
MYKGFRIGKKEFWYASPKVQLFMVAMVCFLCPGMYNALGGLGGSGLSDTTAQTNASTALYSVFAVVGFFSGTFANKLGLRLTLALGGLGYSVYAASILCFKHTQNMGFVIFAGSFLGLCAGLLWCGQGAIMMAYPPERSKGRYISWFWIIFNLGAVIGALIPLGQNINNTGGDATDGTFVGFIVLMVIGAILALFLCNADKVQREDGSHVILMKSPSWRSEFIGLFETITTDPMIVLLFPMFFASNIFYTYQQNGMNGAHFNARGKSLNNLLYWLAQIFGAVIFGYALDYAKLRRSVRAKASLVVLFALTFVIWGGGYAWQIQQVDRAVTEDEEWKKTNTWDWENGGGRLFVGPMFLYMFYGFYDAAWQTCIYWYMGSLSNSGRRLSNLAGFYKGIQSAGAAIFWRLDNLGTEYMTEFAATWGVCAAALLIAAPIIFLRITDTVSIEDDLKFSDETVEDVAPQAVLEERGFGKETEV